MDNNTIIKQYTTFKLNNFNEQNSFKLKKFKQRTSLKKQKTKKKTKPYNNQDINANNANNEDNNNDGNVVVNNAINNNFSLPTNIELLTKDSIFMTKKLKKIILGYALDERHLHLFFSNINSYLNLKDIVKKNYNINIDGTKTDLVSIINYIISYFFILYAISIDNFKNNNHKLMDEISNFKKLNELLKIYGCFIEKEITLDKFIEKCDKVNGNVCLVYAHGNLSDNGTILLPEKTVVITFTYIGDVIKKKIFIKLEKFLFTYYDKIKEYIINYLETGTNFEKLKKLLNNLNLLLKTSDDIGSLNIRIHMPDDTISDMFLEFKETSNDQFKEDKFSSYFGYKIFDHKSKYDKLKKLSFINDNGSKYIVNECRLSTFLKLMGKGIYFLIACRDNSSVDQVIESNNENVEQHSNIRLERLSSSFNKKMNNLSTDNSNENIQTNIEIMSKKYQELIPTFFKYIREKKKTSEADYDSRKKLFDKHFNMVTNYEINNMLRVNIFNIYVYNIFNLLIFLYCILLSCNLDDDTKKKIKADDSRLMVLYYIYNINTFNITEIFHLFLSNNILSLKRRVNLQNYFIDSEINFDNYYKLLRFLLINNTYALKKIAESDDNIFNIYMKKFKTEVKKKQKPLIRLILLKIIEIIFKILDIKNDSNTEDIISSIIKEFEYIDYYKVLDIMFIFIYVIIGLDKLKKMIEENRAKDPNLNILIYSILVTIIIYCGEVNNNNVYIYDQINIINFNKKYRNYLFITFMKIYSGKIKT